MQDVDYPALVEPALSSRPSQGAKYPGWVPDALGVLWVLAAGIAVLLPALFHGLHLGPYDLLSQYGLSAHPGVVVHNTSNGDQIDQMVPWTTLVWTQVHHGQLPLWNPYNGFGTPLAFNWQSAPFGLPALVGYLAPMQYAYTVGIIVTLTVAGTGAYVLGRVLHLGMLGSAMAGTVFELSGPFIGWLGWPHAAVISWAGWLFAAGILIARGKHRVRNITFFAVILAAAIYAGQPEVLVLLLFAFLVFMIVLLIQNALRDGTRASFRTLGDLVVAGLAGATLAAPLALPGLQLVGGSIRSTAGGGAALPTRDVTHLVFQGFDGLPIPGGGHGAFYSETAAYIGIIAIVLAAVGVVWRWRRPEIAALSVVALATGAIVFVPFVASFMGGLPGVGSVSWHRSLLTLAFSVAVLAGAGVDALVVSHQERIWWWTGIAFAVSGVVLAVLYVVTVVHLPPVPRSIRARSFIWPTVDIVIGLGAVGAFLTFCRRRQGQRGIAASQQVNGKSVDTTNVDPDERRPSPDEPQIERRTEGPRRITRMAAGQLVGLVLLVFETLFLITAGAPIFSSSAHFLSPNPAELELQQAVGSSTVGIGAGTSFGGFGCVEMGLIPDTNDVYGIHELGLYDPTTPKAYYQTWMAVTGQSSGVPSFNEFCPYVKTVATARRFGVGFVLEPKGVAGPRGSTFVEALDDEKLYRIPGGAAATLVPSGEDGEFPSASAPGKPVAVTHSSPMNWTVRTDATTPQVLRLRLSDVPGWHASIDGKPLGLQQFSGVMLQARVPAGKHVIELNYWPDAFNMGLALACCALFGLLAAGAVAFGMRRKGRTELPSNVSSSGRRNE